MIATNPLLQTPRPEAAPHDPEVLVTGTRPESSLRLMEGDRTWPVWAFLLGSGLRIGELVSLRWASVDLEHRRVRMVDFVSTLGYDLRALGGKSQDAVRTIELDDGLVDVLGRQKVIQKTERLAANKWDDSDLVFTRESGGQYHPMNLSRLLAIYSTELGLPRLTAHGLRHTCATADARGRDRRRRWLLSGWATPIQACLPTCIAT